RAERAVGDPVRGADEGKVAQTRVGKLVADTDEGPAGIERLGEHVQDRASSLEQLDQGAVRAELVVANLVKETGGAADVHALLVVLGIRKGGFDHQEEGRFGTRELRILEPPPELPAPEREAHDLLVQVLGGPVYEP